jgi:16S rRNA (guanine(966)-N(2))-methyltransferase RsmD
MRIISGKYRGMTLAEFKGNDIRPTADRVKESLFNILSYRVVGAKVLDLFCGSGNLGVECLSRGAEFVHFNDQSKESITVLKNNLAKLKGQEKYDITTSDYLTCLANLRGTFDLIFIDPPYRQEYGIPALDRIVMRSLLAEEGLAIYERDRAFTGTIDGLILCDERKYGKTYLSFFKKE